MQIDALTAAIDAGRELFALEQEVRRQDGALADMLVAHREAIRRDGSRALLQRLGRPCGSLWLEPLFPDPIVGQPLWGHEGPIASLRVADELLVVRGGEGDRVRSFDARGVCHEDRPSQPSDDMRRLGEVLVELRGEQLRLREPETLKVLETVALPSSDGYSWLEHARLLDDGMVALKIGEDYPGSLYGPQYEWFRMDPRDGSRARIKAPSERVGFAGRVAVPMRDGSVRLVEDPAQLEPKPAHEWGVDAVALGPGRFVSVANEGMRIHDREGRLLVAGEGFQRGTDQIILSDPIVTTTRYLHQHVHERPHAQLWDAHTAKPTLRVDAGERYQDMISADPSGSRVAYTVDGKLCLRELRPHAEVREVPLTWHWDRRLAWSPDGLRLAVQHSGRAPTVWSLASQARERLLTTDVLDSAHFGVSEDGAVVTVDHSFYRLRAIRVLDGEPLPSLEPGLNVKCSMTRGTKGVCGGVEGGFHFDLSTHARTRVTEAYVHACHVRGPLAVLAGKAGVHALALDSGELLWSWSDDEDPQPQIQVALVPSAWGPLVVSLGEQGLLTTLREGEVWMQRGLAPTPARRGGQLCALPDGSVLIARHLEPLRRWDPITGDLIDEYALGQGQDQVWIRALSYGGGKVCCCLRSEREGEHSLCFELDSRVPVPLPPGAELPYLTPDGQRLISLDTVARLDLLDARTGELLEQRPFGSWARAEELAFVDGELVARERAQISDGVHEVRASEDGLIEVRRAGELVARWVSPRRWSCVAIDGDRVAAGDHEGRLALWAVREA